MVFLGLVGFTHHEVFGFEHILLRFEPAIGTYCDDAATDLCHALDEEQYAGCDDHRLELVDGNARRAVDGYFAVCQERAAYFHPAKIIAVTPGKKKMT